MEEILHHLIDNLSHYLQGFIYIPGGAGFLPSTVVQVFFFFKLIQTPLLPTTKICKWVTFISFPPRSLSLCSFSGLSFLKPHFAVIV